MNLRQTHKPRNYLARREQWRLLVLVLSLGLVAGMISKARDPKSFAWFAALEDPSRWTNAANVSSREAEVDNRLPPRPAREEVPGTFVSPAAPQRDPAGDGRYFRGVKPECLSAVVDDTTFRYDERDAWFNLLDVLKKTDEATLRKASTGRVTFAQLFNQSRDYRGQLVTLVGTIRRAHRLTAPRNDFGIETYYQTWLQSDDNRESPMVVYCLNLPKGFPTGMNVAEDVEITGFYFKRWAYKAQDSPRTVPALLTRTVEWRPRTPVAQTAPMDTFTILSVVGTALLASLVIVVFAYVRTRPSRLSRSERPPDISILP